MKVIACPFTRMLCQMSLKLNRELSRRKAFKMKKVMIIIACAFILLVYASTSMAGQASVEKYDLPRFSEQGSNSFVGIGIDGRSRKISLAKSGGWCEFPQNAGVPSFAGAFMAPTKGFELTAVASTSSGVYVFDVLSNSIMTGGRNIALSQNIGSVSGMAVHQGKVYLAKKGSSKIYVVESTGKIGEISGTLNGPGQLIGLASDGESLWAARSSSIMRLNANGKAVETYNLGIQIDGLTHVQGKIFLAPAQGRGMIYKIDLK